MEPFTPVPSLIGGLVIGLAAALMLLLNGKIAGISGILGGLLPPKEGGASWRILFLFGLLVGGAACFFVQPQAFHFGIQRSPGLIFAAGSLVGFGTQLGSGCTSGHGVCGISRFSPRSIVATLTFMGTGALAAWVVTQLFGGAL